MSPRTNCDISNASRKNRRASYPLVSRNSTSSAHNVATVVHSIARTAPSWKLRRVPVFAKFADLVVLRAIDIYGSPSEKVLEQLRRKADLLGTATVTVHDRRAGFARFGS